MGIQEDMSAFNIDWLAQLEQPANRSDQPTEKFEWNAWRSGLDGDRD